MYFIGCELTSWICSAISIHLNTENINFLCPKIYSSYFNYESGQQVAISIMLRFNLTSDDDMPDGTSDTPDAYAQLVSNITSFRVAHATN